MLSFARTRLWHEWKVRQLAYREYARKESARPYMRQRGFIINPYAFGAGPTDPNFASVISLVHFDGTAGDTGPHADIIANRAPGWTALAAGPSLQVASAKWGTAGLSVSSVGVYNADHADWNFGSGDFTVECWFYLATTTGFQVVMGDWDSVSGNKSSFLAFTNGDKMVFGSSTTNASWDWLNTSTNSLSTSTWYHLAICRSSTTVRGFIDGTEDVTSGTLTGAVVNNAVNIALGNTPNNPGTLSMGAGSIDEFRATTMARYTPNFTPPTAAFPDS